MQGIVERKNSIPILSNVLARGAGAASCASPPPTSTSRCAAAARPRSSRRARSPSGRRSSTRSRARCRRATCGSRCCPTPGPRSSASGCSFKMAGLPREDFPTLPEAKAAKGVEIPGEVLRDLIARTAFAITAEDARYYLAGALLVLDKDGAAMVATDGHRLSYARRKAALKVTEASACSSRARRSTSSRACSRREESGHLPAGGQPPRLRGRRPHAGLEDDRGTVPRLREGHRRHRRQGRDPGPRGAWPTAIRRVSLLSSERSRAVQARPRAGQARARRLLARPGRGARVAARGLHRARPSRSASTPSTCSTSWARPAREQVALELKDPRARALFRPAGEARDSTTATSSCRCGSRRPRESWCGWSCEIADLRNIRRGEAGAWRRASTSSWDGTPRARPSLLEAVGLLARGRSFRTEETRSAHPAAAPRSFAAARPSARTTGRETAPRGRGRPPGRGACAWTGARWRRGSTRAASTWSSTRRSGCGWSAARCASAGSSSTAAPPRSGPPTARALRDYERVRRGSATRPSRSGGRGLEAWDERLRRAGGARCASAAAATSRGSAQALGARLPRRRRDATRSASTPRRPPTRRTASSARAGRRARGAARATSGARGAAWSGPHRDAVALSIDGAGRGRAGLGGQARSLLLALTPGDPRGLPRRSGAARRWRCSTTSIRSSTRSARARSAARWRARPGPGHHGAPAAGPSALRDAGAHLPRRATGEVRAPEDETASEET